MYLCAHMCVVFVVQVCMSLHMSGSKMHVGVVVCDDSVMSLHAVQVCACACIVFKMFHSVFHTEMEGTEQVR